MSLIGTGFIDPKDYPFKKFIDEQKHLDTDELRHKMQPIKVRVEDMCGEEHLFCDKQQLNAEGKFRRPKKLMEAEKRGIKTVMDMDMADKKEEEDKKIKEVSDLRDFTVKQNDVIKKLIEKQDNLEKTIIDQNNLLQEIINRLRK